jgi:hypothetical protein
MSTAGTGTTRDDADKVVTSGGVTRRSILALEGTWEMRMCAILTFMLVALLISMFSSIAFMTTLGLMPSQPSTSNFIKALYAYQSYATNVSDTVKADMKTVYLTSKVNQSSDCAYSISLATYQQNLSLGNATNYVSNYCKDLSNRVWTAATAANSASTSGTIAGCPATDYAATTSTSFNYVWVTTPNSSAAALLGSAFNCTEPWDTAGLPQYLGKCYYAFYKQNNPTNSRLGGGGFCTTFDKWTNLVFPSTSARTCDGAVRPQLDSIVAPYNPSNQSASQSFLDSLNARLEYDRNYFLAWANTQDLLSQMQSAIAVAQNDVKQYQKDAEAAYATTKTYMDNARTSMNGLQNIYSTFSSVLPPFPSYTFPPFSTSLSLQLGGLDFTDPLSKLSTVITNIGPVNWPTYSPPSLSIQTSVSISGLNLSTYKPSVGSLPDLQGSVLLQDIKSLVSIIGSILTGVSTVDILWRIVHWIQQNGLIVQVTRRNLVSLKSKIKQAIGTLLSYSVPILYLSLILAFSSKILTYDLSFGFLTEELGNQCQNAVVTDNAGTLAGYQTELVNSRAQCDAAIDSYNLKTSNMNNLMSAKLMTMTSVYETFYVSSINTTTTPTLLISGTNFPTINLNVSASTLKLYTGLYAPHNNVTGIESYAINKSLCTDTTTAKEVTQNMNDVTKQLQKWISAVCFALVFSNIGNMLMINAVYSFFWMYLTRGYIFDEAFDSKRLRAVIRTKRITGVIMFILGIGFVILAALNKLVFYGHF